MPVGQAGGAMPIRGGKARRVACCRAILADLQGAGARGCLWVFATGFAPGRLGTRKACCRPLSMRVPYPACPALRPSPLRAPKGIPMLPYRASQICQPCSTRHASLFLPPRLDIAPNHPPDRWARDTPAPPLRCVALRAPRPLFPWPAPHCPTMSSPRLFKLRRRRCSCPPLVEQFETFRWRQHRRETTHSKEKVSGCARQLNNTNAAQFFFKLKISKAKVGNFFRTCKGSICQKLPNSLRRKRL